MQNWKRLGTELMAESRYPESIKAFSSYLKDNPRDDEVLTSRGIAYASNNQFKKARSDFKLAIKINKDNAGSPQRIGSALCKSKEISSVPTP